MGVINVSTIGGPEFINVKPYNQLISECEIKVLYVGDNRNKTNITKEVATEMANTLPGCPIVGYYNENTEDFEQHNKDIVIDEKGIRFKSMTMPYGFVAPNAKIWFQMFEETDSTGITSVREYLMTTGFLWTGQFEEAKRILERGNGQSMELDNDLVQGTWTKSDNGDYDFFIINDAVFSKLCILGENVEPCFEGATITKKSPISSFSKNEDDFKITYYNMMQEFKFALEGGNMDLTIENQEEVVEEAVIEETVVATEEEVVEASVEEEVVETVTIEENLETLDKADENISEENQETTESQNGTENYSELATKYDDLLARYNLLETDYQAAIEFRKQVEDTQKTDLINSFYMLSDDDKKDVLDNKSEYSLDDIESKLSVICVRKKVNFDLNDEAEEVVAEDDITTYTLQDNDSSVPAWIKAMQSRKQK